MTGMSRATGGSLEGMDHLRQSVTDILSTPIGSRVMRREYGSRLYQLVDAPLNAATMVEIYMATAEALKRWEPRIKLARVRVESLEAGHVTLTLEGRYRPGGRILTLEGVII